MKFVSCICLTAFLGISSQSLQAALIQYQFTGTVLGVHDTSHQLNGIVQLGDPYTATFSFDSDSPDLAPDNPAAGTYAGPSATLVMPNLTVQSTSYLFVRHDVTGDSLRFSPSSSFLSPYFEVAFDDYSGTSLTSDAFPTTSAIAMFGQGSLGAIWISVPAKFIASATVIPEPGASLLMLAGMVSIWAQHKRRM